MLEMLTLTSAIVGAGLCADLALMTDGCGELTAAVSRRSRVGKVVAADGRTPRGPFV